MDIENLNVGEKYNLKLLCTHCEEKVVVFETPTGYHIPLRNGDIECLILENGRKNSEPAPKYDPCRPFRKGDIVEPCSVNGRWCTHTWKDRAGIHYEVAKDEDPLTAHMEVKDPDSPHPFLVHATFFKLVTPVEEQEPYSVVQPENYQCVRIMKGKMIHSSIPFDAEECVCRTLEEAKAAAEAECARLNAEHRKEQK